MGLNFCQIPLHKPAAEGGTGKVWWEYDDTQCHSFERSHVKLSYNGHNKATFFSHFQ